MTQTAHTPGPWKAVTTDVFGSITIEAGGRSICDIIGTMPVDEANARVIAAALDMAEALKFYADQSKWTDVERIVGVDGRQYDLPPKILLDLGRVASAALAKAGVE